MYLLILLLPLLGFFFSGVFGRYFGRQMAPLFSTFTIFLSLFFSILAFNEVALSGSILSIKLSTWILFDAITINFGLLFDSLTCIMLLIVTGISFFVHVYSMGYMSHDPHITRFMSYLSLFTFFMLALVTADNYVQMFIGWEGVGLCSYLLINFWFTRVLANKAALKAMIMNRIADVFLSIGIIMILLTFKTSDYLIVFSLVDYVQNDYVIFFNYKMNKLTLICFLLFVGGVGKSAQLGLHTWLPDAMEGPTPVSSLLHAATMVTAGVFLIIRSSPLFEFSETILLFTVIIGGFTAFFSAIIGVFQYDVKKIIAYSTCSQLGYMFFSCGLSNYQVAIFHLFNHAFFKALLFLSAGSIIHALYDEQDMRRMGGLVNYLPFTYLCILVGSMAIMGFPFLTGFYSKDLVLELAYSRYIIDASFIHFLGVSAAFFTSVYSIRLLLFVFFFSSNSFKSFFTSHESEGFMLFSMVFLLIASIFVGFLFSDICVGWGTYLWNNSIFLLPSHFNHIEADFLHPLIKNLPIIVSFVGFFLGILLTKNLNNKGSVFLTPTFNIFWSNIASFFYNAGFFNTVYNKIFLILFNTSYTTSNKYIDKGWLEFLGPFGLYKLFRGLNIFLRQSPPSVIFFYIGFMFFAVILFFVFLFLHISFLMFLALNTEIIGLFFMTFFLHSIC